MTHDLAPSDACAQATAAAGRADVRIRTVHGPGDCATAADLVTAIWDPVGGATIVDANLLHALAFAGSYVALAEDTTGRAIGVGIAFLANPVELILHSHIVGLAPGAESRGAGYALKLHQRAWALERGLRTMEWTYDPLIRRNAQFNLRKLGARAAAYHVDFYGAMADARNAGFGSDRVLVHWDLSAPLPEPGAEPERPPAAIGTRPDSWVAAVGDEPRAIAVPAPGRRGTIALPPDIEAVRAHDPDLARRWRSTVRNAFVATLGAGTHVVTELDEQGRYLLEAI